MAGADKRASIMAAAERLFTTRRFHEITLDEVARGARVGKGTIYLHFRDKEDLFFQVATAGFDELCAVLSRAVPHAAPFRQRLDDACAEVGAFFERRRPWLRMIQAEDARMACCASKLRERWTAKRELLVDAVGGILRQGVAGGLIRQDIPLDVLANFLLGMLRTRIRKLRDVPRGGDHGTLADLFLNGAANRGGTRTRKGLQG